LIRLLNWAAMKKIKILIAEDNDLSRENLAELLSESGYEVKAVKDGKEAMDAFPCDKYDLVITDMKMPHADGLHLLKFIKEINPENIVIVITGHATVDSAVDAMRMGAFDYITKPLKKDLVDLTVKRALSHARLRDENIALKSHLEKKYNFGKIVSYSDGMKNVVEKIKKVAASDSTVAIYGESGTGKELVAQALHFNSDRKNGPLVTVNCGAIPEELLESELFGHEKGAFTGAIRSRTGRFELAHGGTIFLDEIGELSQAAQAKVLRVLQERQLQPVGSSRTVTVNVRIIAATNRNLEQDVTEGRFRADLFYRLNVFPIYMPTLRERGSDIILLADHFILKYAKILGKKVKRISTPALDMLLAYHWPGNVRELENSIERAVILAPGDSIESVHLPPSLQMKSNESAKKERGKLDTLVSAYERSLIIDALKDARGNQSKAAKFLGTTKRIIQYKITKYDIDPQRFKAKRIA